MQGGRKTFRRQLKNDTKTVLSFSAYISVSDSRKMFDERNEARDVPKTVLVLSLVALKLKKGSGSSNFVHFC